MVLANVAVLRISRRVPCSSNGILRYRTSVPRQPQVFYVGLDNSRCCYYIVEGKVIKGKYRRTVEFISLRRYIINKVDD